MESIDRRSRATVNTQELMMSLTLESYMIYLKTVEESFGKMQDPYRYPSQQNARLDVIEASNDLESQEIERDGTGVKRHTRRRLRRMHAHRRRNRRHR